MATKKPKNTRTRWEEGRWIDGAISKARTYSASANYFKTERHFDHGTLKKL